MGKKHEEAINRNSYDWWNLAPAIRKMINEIKGLKYGYEPLIDLEIQEKFMEATRQGLIARDRYFKKQMKKLDQERFLKEDTEETWLIKK